MTLFRWDREPPGTWQQALGGLAGPADRLSHLVLWWESGTPQSPVQRWVVYEAIPAWAMEGDPKLGLLLEDGVCQCPREVQDSTVCCPACHHPAQPGRRRIYRTLQDTGYFAQPCWVIQGHQGGHPYWLGPEEAAFRQLAGLPTEVPRPGDLDYAPFDGRVLHHLRQRDHLHAGFGTLANAWTAMRTAWEVAGRRAWLAARDAAVDRALDETASGLPWGEMPQAHDAPVADLDQWDEAFVARGRGPTQH